MARNVCVIGTETRDELWGAPEKLGSEIVPVGETLFINAVPLAVIGMFQHYESEQDRKERLLAQSQASQPQTDGVARNRGWWGGGRRRGNFVFYLKNTTVYIPLNTVWMQSRSGASRIAISYGGASRTVTGTTGDPRLSSLGVKIAGVDRLPEALQQVRNVLMCTHKGIEDFTLRTQEDWAEQINVFVHNPRLSGGLIAGISLLVGGIGIMNIMLASINERIREIAICKAVGATGWSIFTQVLIESIVIALLGAALGVVTSFGFVRVLEQISPTANTPVITPGAMLIAVVFSAAVWVCAGLFPALKAARLDPIQPLRYE
jgi:putative ABC transport system permease protein